MRVFAKTQYCWQSYVTHPCCQLVARKRKFINPWPGWLLEQCILRYQSELTKNGMIAFFIHNRQLYVWRNNERVHVTIVAVKKKTKKYYVF